MCLCVDIDMCEKKSSKFLNNNISEIKVYKILRLQSNKSPFENFTWKEGLNIAEGILSDGNIIGEGAFHAFASKERAETLCDRIVELKVKVEDIIAYSSDSQICFTKAVLSKKWIK